MIPYRTNSTADELAVLMDRALRSKAAGNDTNADNINQSLICLARAADILEGLQEHKASEAITVIIEKLAGER